MKMRNRSQVAEPAVPTFVARAEGSDAAGDSDEAHPSEESRRADERGSQ